MGVPAALLAEFDAAFPLRHKLVAAKPDLPDRRPVCVTSAASFLGAALVRSLLRRGFAVRIAIDAEGDAEKLAECEELAARAEGVVVADVAEVESLRAAFEGCAAVFHSGGFADPGGFSGYTKVMAEMEATAAENVVEACARTTSVRKCIFTSSLLACVWRREYPRHLIDERCWSDVDLCRNNKLWLALGKTMAERAVWKKAHERGIKLATICPGLLVGRDFHLHNPTASIAYLKGAYEMYRRNLLATVDVDKAANAHVVVYEAMNTTGGGRYVCFDRIIHTTDAAAELERQLGLPRRISSGDGSEVEQLLTLSDNKLSTLASRIVRCLYEASYSILD